MTEVAAIMPATDGDASLREAPTSHQVYAMARRDVRVDAGDVARGQIAGRVELVSGQATHFPSLQELLGFIAQVLADGPHKEG